MCAAQQSADPTSDLPAASKVELPAVSAVELLPARMLNEFVYCPRLFYYEHVEGVFLHSADTKKGAAEHTRVDAGKGELPPAKTAATTASGIAADSLRWTARSSPTS